MDGDLLMHACIPIPLANTSIHRVLCFLSVRGISRQEKMRVGGTNQLLYSYMFDVPIIPCHIISYRESAP